MATQQEHSDRLSAVFSALSHPARRAMLVRLARGDASVQELGAPFAFSQPTISRHLKVLEEAGLVERTQDAQRRPSRLRVRAIKDAADWMEPFRRLWERRLANLDRHLAATRPKERR